MGSLAALRNEFLEGVLQGLDRILREDGVLVAEQIVGVNLGAEHKLDTVEVARAEIELLVELAAGLNQQSGLAGLELVESSTEEFGLRLCDFERIDDSELAVGDLGGN